MDRLDEALYGLGRVKAEQAALAEKKEAVLSLAERGKTVASPKPAYACAIAAALVVGLFAGAIMQQSGVFSAPAKDPYVYIGGSVPMTDPASPSSMSQAVRPLEWSEDASEDVRLEDAPTSADTRAFHLAYIPDGMTAAWDHDAGLLEVADAERTRSILAMLCLRYGLASEEYEGLAEGCARAKVKTSEFGETGGVSWVLRLNQDVYFYISVEGMTYEESERFVQGIHQQ